LTFDKNDIFDIGTGIYTIPDIASILRLPTTKVRRWMKEYWNEKFAQGEHNTFSQGSGKEQVTNFYTLIEFYTFYQLRLNGVSSFKINKAHDVLAKVYKTKYPFAKSNILTDGKNVFFSGEVGEIIEADKTLQINIKEILEPFCKSIDFDVNSLATRFYPLGKNHEIIIDPHRQFGQPVIGDTNILTETVFDLYRAGEPLKVIANIFELTSKQVKDAIDFHRNAA
jgi:uncharacterized protein (DUF433 family)